MVSHIVRAVLSHAGGHVGPVPGIVGDNLDHVVIAPLPGHGEEHPAIGGGEGGVG